MQNYNGNEGFLAEFFHTIWLYLRDFLLGASAGGLGHTVSYSHSKHILNKDITFNFIIFLLKMISGGFIGWIVGASLPPSIPFRDFIVATAGISGFTIILILDKQGIQILFKRILNIDIKKDENDTRSI